MNLKYFVLFLSLLFVCTSAFGQWDPDAGIVIPLSNSATADASSRDSIADNVIDGDINTNWESDFYFPFPYLVQANHNILLNTPDSLFCSSLPKDSVFIDSTFLVTVQVDSFFLDTIVVDSIALDTFMMDSIFLDTIVVDSIGFDTLQVDSVFFDATTMMNDTVQVDSIVMDTFMIDSIFYDTIVVDSMVMDTFMVDSTFMASVMVDSTYLDSIPLLINVVDNNDYSVLTDGDINNGNIIMPVVDSLAWLGITFDTERPVLAISVKLFSPSDVDIYAYTTPTDSTLIGTFETGVHDYQLVRFEIFEDSVHQIKMWSPDIINLFELGALEDYPKESVTVDLGASQPVQQIVARYWAGDQRAAATSIFISEDSTTWFELAQLDPDNMGELSVVIDFDTTARYIKIEHSMALLDYGRVFVWEIAAFDANGIYMNVPAPKPGNKTLHQILGMNTLWGWGYNQYTEFTPAGEGPDMFDTISSFARNYHFMDWDVGDPDSIPVYINMATSGTHYGFEWLDWDREYEQWITRGVDPHACIMFSHAFGPDAWDSLNFSSAYAYGYEFAKYFGPTQGNGNIDKIEIGNEPWYYDSTDYRLIMSNMARGIKDADPAIEVFPCALQAHDKVAEQSIIGLKNYIGTRVTPADTAFIDGVNIHAYCWAIDSTGERIGVKPESPVSEFRSITNMIKWRDVNMPNKKIIVSEWGYDIDSPSEPCMHSECVSERAGAVYTARAALMLQRWDVDEATIFWFANSVDTSTTFNRSGVLNSTNSAFSKKNVFEAMTTLVDSLEQAYFLDVIQEDDDAYLYLYSDSLGNASHLVAWRPENGDDTQDVDAMWYTPDYVPLHATRVIGEQVGGTSIAAPTYSNDTMYLSINTAPTIIRLADNPCVDHLTISNLGSTTLFAADSTIISDAIIPMNSLDSIRYQAGQSITLDNGFHSDGTTHFKANIEECVIDSLLPLMQKQSSSPE